MGVIFIMSGRNGFDWISRIKKSKMEKVEPDQDKHKHPWKLSAYIIAFTFLLIIAGLCGDL
jgi:hypothetical protein